MKIPTKREREMNDAVMNRSMKIKETAKAFAVSPSTVRRAMDKVTEFSCAKFTIELNGSDVQSVLGWLRNGNSTSKGLADRIQYDIECDSIKP